MSDTVDNVLNVVSEAAESEPSEDVVVSEAVEPEATDQVEEAPVASDSETGTVEEAPVEEAPVEEAPVEEEVEEPAVEGPAVEEPAPSEPVSTQEVVQNVQEILSSTETNVSGNDLENRVKVLEERLEKMINLLSSYYGNMRHI